MNILIRLPNWLGDMVMSTSFVKAVKIQFPEATVDLIAKKGLDSLLEYFPSHGHRYIFSKEDFNGLRGARKFGIGIRKKKKYDLFFCLPDSFSSALMGHASGAKKRVGFKKELRSLFLTHAFTKKINLHRVEEYVDLLSQFKNLDLSVPPVELVNTPLVKKNTIVINVNSEATSRRLPKEKAISILSKIRHQFEQEIILIGSEKESVYVNEIISLLPDKTDIINLAGKTNLREMVNNLGSCKVMFTTDSGPAHVANAIGVQTIILFGAGNEKNTAPYNVSNRCILRLGNLTCEPCVSNTCKLFGIPKCLTDLDENLIIESLKNKIN